MIPAKEIQNTTIYPKIKIFGLFRPHELVSNTPKKHEIEEMKASFPEAIPAEFSRIRSAGTHLVSNWNCSKAVSIKIGRFDSRVNSSGLSSQSKTISTQQKLRLPSPSGDNSSSRRLAAILQPPLEALLNSNSVFEWPHPLYAYQKVGIEALITRNELLLADDMGLGKTIQAVAALRVLFHKSSIQTALIVCPASLTKQWSREIAKWAPELLSIIISGPQQDRGVQWRLPAHIKIISYDTLRGDVLQVIDSPAKRNEWSVVVLDEASRIKNRETGISRACKQLPRQRRWALTGTPLENKIDDVLSIIEFLNGEPGGKNPVRTVESNLQESLKKIQLRRKKENVLKDLPDKHIIEQSIELLPTQRIAYDRAEKEGIMELEKAGNSISITHILELIIRLKQICNNDPVSGESAKISDIEDRMSTLILEGHRALIFSQFTDNRFGVNMLSNRLAEFSPLTYTGAMSSAQKDSVIQTFTDSIDHKALILSLRSGGVGLNLQAASYVFHLDRWWNPAIEDQAESRSHRMGQIYPVTVFRYICSNTIEERIDEKLRMKRQIFSEIIDDVSIDLQSSLSEDELFDLFGLKSPKKSSSIRMII